MAKISITHPQSTGTPLYGSQREHHGFVCISIRTGNCGDHIMDDTGDDTGFKGAHDSVMKRVHYIYDKSKPSMSKRDERGEDGQYKIGEYMGTELVDAPELKNHDDQEVVEVMMSFEQFAEMLVSTGHQIDCTISHLSGGVGNPGKNYREEITPPPPIYDRAQRRMEKAQEEALREIDEGIANIETWNSSKRIKDSARKTLEMTRQHIIANSGYVVQQAAEELSSVAEGAVSIIHDKVSALEASGRLPKGSTEHFRSGGAAGLLGIADAEEKKHPLLINSGDGVYQLTDESLRFAYNELTDNSLDFEDELWSGESEGMRKDLLAVIKADTLQQAIDCLINWQWDPTSWTATTFVTAFRKKFGIKD